MAIRFLSQSITKTYPAILYLFVCVLLPVIVSILSMMTIENLCAKNHKRYTHVFDSLIRPTYFVSCFQEILIQKTNSKNPSISPGKALITCPFYLRVFLKLKV